MLIDLKEKCTAQRLALDRLMPVGLVFASALTPPWHARTGARMWERALWSLKSVRLRLLRSGSSAGNGNSYGNGDGDGAARAFALT